VRGREGRAAVVGECGFIGFLYEVEKGGERRGVGRVQLDEGGIKEGYGRCFTSSTVEHERAPHGGARRRPSRRRLGQLRWEKTPGWANLGQRLEGLDWQGDFHRKNQVGLPRIPRRTDFGLR
jgi:hypothetical protein